MIPDKIGNKYIAENSTDVSLKTTTKFDESTISGCF